MDLGLAGRVVVVTGGSSGIGRAAAERFAQEGANVVITYRSDRQKAEAVAATIRSTGREVIVGQLDLANRDSIQKVIDSALSRWDRIDVLVNNAVNWVPVADARTVPFELFPPNEWEPLMRSNIEGPVSAIQAVLPAMRRTRWGRIVNVSSVAAVDGMPKYSWYAAAKAALHGLTHTLARELGPDGILVNVVMPGATLTDRVSRHFSPGALERQAAMLPIRRIPDPEEVATTIVFLSSAANTAITGEVVRVSGGR